MTAQKLRIPEAVDTHWRCWSKEVKGSTLAFWTKDRDSISLKFYLLTLDVFCLESNMVEPFFVYLMCFCCCCFALKLL